MDQSGELQTLRSGAWAELAGKLACVRACFSGEKIPADPCVCSPVCVVSTPTLSLPLQRALGILCKAETAASDSDIVMKGFGQFRFF